MKTETTNSLIQFISDLEDQLAKEYAMGWLGVYDDETRQRLGRESARVNLNPVFRAITSLGLVNGILL